MGSLDFESRRRGDRRVIWFISAVTLLSFALRAYHIDFQSLWRDEVDALVFATRDLSVVVGNFTKTGENGPLYFLLLRFWIGGTGATEFALRFFSLLFGVMTVPLAYAMGRRFLEPAVGMFAGALAAVSPFYIWYSQEAKMYSLLTFLTLLSVYLYLVALQGNRRWTWAAYVIITSLCIYIHFFSPLIVFLEIVVFVCGLRRWRGAFKGWAISIGLLTLPYVPLAIWEIPVFLKPPPTAYPFLDPSTILSVLAFAFSISFSPLPVLILLSAFMFLCLAGLLLYTDRLKPDDRGSCGGWETPVVTARQWIMARSKVMFLLLYFLLPVAGFYLVSLRMPLFTERYLIIVSPAYYLLLACGLVVLQRRSFSLLGLCIAAILVASGYSTWMQSHTKIKSDFRGAAAYVAQHSERGDPMMFIMPYVTYSFAYYYRGELEVEEAPYTNNDIGVDEVDLGLRRQMTGNGGVWLVLAEPGYHDSRGLVKNWFDRNGSLVDSRVFPGVEVRHYSLPGSVTSALQPALP